MTMNALADGSAKRDRLARRRKALGLTQEALAELLDVARSTVVRWERGESEPAPRIRPKLAKALRVSPDGLEGLLGAGVTVAVTTVPRQLPATVPDFTGRAAELAALTRMLDEADTRAPGTVVISAIGGTAGVGKTALALHWAHQVASRFSDGQLHVNLRGFDPSGSPATPAEAIRGLLDSLGVRPERIPPTPDAQENLYRSLLADKRLLIVLDNARDERQVRPLLPASTASLIVVTSRSPLAGLAAAVGARLLILDVLTHEEAIQLLSARLGAEEAAEPTAIAEIASLCACLPLALAVAAARAAGRPKFPLAALAAEVRNSAGRLDILDAGDPATSVRAVFSWSYRQLSAGAARMFRLLGLHPGPDIGVRAAASLAGTDEASARRLLQHLSRASLIAEHAPGRYALHDLLRTYAAEQARAHDNGPERAAAIRRVLDHYLHTARLAAPQLWPGYEPVVVAPPSPGVTAHATADYEEATAWFEAEYRGLLAAVTVAAESGLDRHAWQLTWAMTPFLSHRRLFQEWVAIQRTALTAATRLGDIEGQAVSSRLLAAVSGSMRDHDQALAHYTDSLTLYRRAGNRLGEALVRQGLARMCERQRDYAGAIVHARHARRLFRAIGDKAGEAVALNALGWCCTHIGDYQEARALCERSVSLGVAAGNRMIEVAARDSLGFAEHHRGNFAEAITAYERALSLCRELGQPGYEAEILTHIGDTRHAAGELPQAREAWKTALAILEDLQHANAGEVRAKLASADDP